MEHRSPCPVSCPLVFVLLLQLPCAGSVEEFLVIGPSDPITAVVGGNITLPCHVSPAMNAENMELRWFRAKFSEAVFIYRNQQEEMEDQMTQYRGRTSMEKDLLSQGVGVVTIHKIQVSDAGRYTCFFRKEGFSKQAGLQLNVVDELQAYLDQRKADYLSAWRKAHLYADWRKDQFQACSVTLDPGSACSGIVISHENKSLTLKNTTSGMGERHSILGQEGITSSGRCCWEVKIKNGDRSNWLLGVCREDAKRTDFYRESPGKGFWVIGQYEDGYCAHLEGKKSLLLRQFSHSLAIFLDYEEGDISFYDMTDGSHIFSFPQVSFSGTLFPYFMIMSGDVSLTICSLEGESEHAEPHNSDHFWEEPLSPLEEGFSPDSGVVEAPSGPETPLLPHNSDNMFPSSRGKPVRILEEGLSTDPSVDNGP